MKVFELDFISTVQRSTVMSEIILSSEQKKIVDTIDGAILVKAGPGSGKTRVVIERIKKLLKSKQRVRVLALTFSNLAADEMRERLEMDLSVKDLLSYVTIGTIHSFCLDLVQKHKSLIGLQHDLMLFEDNSERKLILKSIFLQDIQLKQCLLHKENPDQILNDCLNRISELKRKFISPDIYSDRQFAQIYEAYNDNLRDQNAIDFDDILFFAYRILNENPRVAKLYTSVYKYICVDEAQDLNFAQYEVLRALCGSKFKNIMLVGDDKQSIYGFNGSDSSLMTEKFVSDFSPITYELNENYRSATAIIEFANTIEGSNITAVNYKYEGELKAFSFIDELTEAKYIIDKICDLIKTGHKDIQGKLELENFAVIARNKYAFNQLEEQLTERGIDYFFKRSSLGISNESDYMQMFDWGMRLFINPKDIVHLNKLKNKLKLVDMSFSSNMTIAQTELKKLFEDHQLFGISQSMDYWGDRIFDLDKALNCVENQIVYMDDEEEHYFISNDIQQWRQHWKKYKNQVSREYRSLNSFRSYVSLGKTQDTSNDTGISLLTAHMSKGLQYDVVFVIGLTEGTFPDYRAIGNDEMNQERNNFYVAVTRAKRLCYLTYPKKKKMPWGGERFQKESQFLNGLVIQNITQT